MNLRQRSGAKVRAMREGCGMTQEALASRCRLPLSALALIESGDAALGSEELVKIASVLGTTPDVLLDGVRWDQDQMRFVVEPGSSGD
ncbi:MAG TPA: helix-turn-helix transcriptional regulator [Solirubrobacterales bacterium]|nr:helix-turn-helix transcriptional regulator [Solirubrobacterales bacterium]